LERKLPFIYRQALWQCCAKVAVALLCAYPMKSITIVSTVCSLTFCCWGFIFVLIVAYIWYDEQIVAVLRAIYLLVDGMGLYYLAEATVARDEVRDLGEQRLEQKLRRWEGRLQRQVNEDQQEGTENPKFLWICQRAGIAESTFVNEDVEKEDVESLKENLQSLSEKLDEILRQSRFQESGGLRMLKKLDRRVRDDVKRNTPRNAIVLPSLCESTCCRRVRLDL